MTTHPPELGILLDGAEPVRVEAAWSALLDRYSRLLLKSVGTLGGDADARMDRYAYVVGELRRDNFRRLRGYRVDATSGFGAWLTVVARRLALDHERTRYGRGDRGDGSDEARAIRAARRRLTELVGSAIDLEVLPDQRSDAARDLAERQVREVLESCLAGLDSRDRLLVRLRFEDDVPVRQIAVVMGFPTVFHVYHRLRAVLDTLRRELGERGVEGVDP
ncbi:MAG: sigma-70 family RNA polymerase sigma factor [Gemmatimonadetes bacterium]|nr:sigma-70 family RNA polymerase sigma factor [Gemmatimonadota bacterium]